MSSALHFFLQITQRFIGFTRNDDTKQAILHNDTLFKTRQAEGQHLQGKGSIQKDANQVYS